MTIKEIRKEMREMNKNGETLSKILVVEGWGQIQKIGSRYAVCGMVDDSDPMTDYSAWTYGMKEKWILDSIKRTLNIA